MKPHLTSGPELEAAAHEYVEACGYTKGTIRAAARKAYIVAYKAGARSGWMRCGVFHIDLDFEARPSEAKNINERWPT